MPPREFEVSIRVHDDDRSGAARDVRVSLVVSSLPWNSASACAAVTEAAPPVRLPLESSRCPPWRHSSGRVRSVHTVVTPTSPDDAGRSQFGAG